MTASSKRKGDNAELELAKILTDLLGVRVRRKLGAGRTDDEGDMDGLRDTTIEVKNYANLADGIAAAIEDCDREQVNAGTTFGVSFVRRRGIRKGPRWIAVMTPEQFCTWYREATG